MYETESVYGFDSTAAFRHIEASHVLGEDFVFDEHGLQSKG